MTSRCKDLRKTLAAAGPAALRNDPAAQEHLVECSACYAFLEALAELERAFPALPQLDAPDEVVEQLLASPELAEPAAGSAAESATDGGRAREPRRPFGRQVWQRISQFTRHLRPRNRLLLELGAAAMIAVVIGIVMVPLFLAKVPMEVPRFDAISQESVSEGEEGFADESSFGYTGGKRRELAEADGLSSVEENERMPSSPPAPIPDASVEPKPILERQENEILKRQTAAESKKLEQRKGKRPEKTQFGHRPRVAPATRAPGGLFDRDRKDEGKEQATPTEAGRFTPELLSITPGVSDTPAQETTTKFNLESSDVAGKDSEISKQRVIAPKEPYASMSLSYREAEGDKIADEIGNDVDGYIDMIVAGELQPVDTGVVQPTTTGVTQPVDTGIATRFLEQRRSLDGLVFQEPRGYWANTYVPGDRALRQLQAELMTWNRDELIPATGGPLRLHERSRQLVQPFDAPDDAALAVYLHADRTGLPSRSRLLLQVGLKGTARRSGRRPAMNVGLVLDLRQSGSVETAAMMRAVVEAFAEAHDLGDRFSLTVAGRSGGVVVPAEDFRYGPLTVALAELLSDESTKAGGLGLVEALSSAYDAVGSADDPSTPLGSSVVVLVTAAPLGSELPPLSELAHRSAVDGVPLSVIGIGSEVRLDELDRLVLAGQGNRRLLGAPAEAAALVDRELAAVSRIIARAVRLRIRLAPGVQLVDVLGSRRLDDAQAQQVRDAEVSIDQRLSRNLGIVADRGLDEEGMQIVIPTFYADDSHVILLDVVAPGPGPLADVSVRYKDLVHLRNGVARDHLSLGWEERPSGPLELNVLKNLLAHEMAEAMHEAAQALQQGERAACLERLEYMRSLLQQLQLVLPGLENDPDLHNDITMLDEYLALIRVLESWPQYRELAIDSLEYAGRLKVVQAPETQQ